MRLSRAWLSVLPDLSFAAVTSRRAEALGSRLPPLLIAAQRIASTVAQGVHGRRRVGQGDSFWQFRPYAQGDPINRVDWRQSARSGREAQEGWLVKQTEWDAAQSVYLWRDASASMAWRSRVATEYKRDRATLLLLALASLLLRGGERVAVIAPKTRLVSGRFGLGRVYADLAQNHEENGMPPEYPLARHGHVVLIGDFLSPLDKIQAAIAGLAGIPVTGTLVQVLDPAETSLPYDGRIRFRGLEGERDALIPRVENIRDVYRGRLKAQQEGLMAICAAAGYGFSIHRTDQSAELALLTLYNALGPR